MPGGGPQDQPVGSLESSAWPAGAIAASYDRRTATTANGNGLSAGNVCGILVPLLTAATASNVNWITGSTQAGVTMTHQWAVICDANGNVLAVTADGGAAALPVNTLITWPLTVPTVLPAGDLYVGLMVAAATVPTVAGIQAGATGQIAIPPALLVQLGGAGQTVPPAVGGVLAPAVRVTNVEPYVYLT